VNPKITDGPLFYYNREDKRILVPKRIEGMGFSLNFSHPVSWVIILLIIAVIAYLK
jgi:uncharacterized membrane protein